ncbi:MAG: HAMP domain-containing sensor histidine kinase [Chloroflexi bacterium]|nr:HAMP domain-containing sensor histidine kinase [Chloroflexota bacterium]
MASSWNPWLRKLYLYLTNGTSSSVEWAWLIGRLAVVGVTVPAAYFTFDGFAGAGVIPLAAAGVLVYSGLLAFLLHRGHTRPTFLIGFVLDNVVIELAWLFTVKNIRMVGTENDLWLIVIPVTVVGVARTGLKLGLIYVALMAGLLAWMTLGFEPPDSYAVSQLPVRTAFFGIVGAITTWLVTQLNMEREAAEDLQLEAEVLSEISQIVGTSLSPVEVFPQISNKLRTLIPFELLMLGEADLTKSTIKILNVGTADDEADFRGEVIELPEDGEFLKRLTRRGPQLLDEDACSIISAVAGDVFKRSIPDIRSMTVSAVISGDGAAWTLFACSSQPDAFDVEHTRILARVAELIGASMTNLQVYGQAIQLANEREARVTLDATNRVLQEDNQARTFFLSAISHELRTPLTSIIAFNDLLLRNKNKNLGERELQQLELIRRNSKQLATLVNDLLDLSYIGSGKVRLTPETFNPTDAIRFIAASINPMLKLKGQRLIWRPQSTDETIVADRERFAQVAANLLSNASKYSPSDSEITLDWSIDDGTFEMSVRDNGSGISESDQSHLFLPFFRSAQHRVDKIPGTGLGLVIAKSLLEAHGGGISVHSSQETGDSAGTEVRVWLPVDGSVLMENARLRQSA